MLMDFKKEQHKENQKTRKDEFETLTNLMKKQNEQRDRFLNLFEKMVNAESNNKRNRRSSSEDSD